MNAKKKQLKRSIQQDIKTFDKHYEIKEVENPKTWQLLMQSTVEREAEEAVFTVQGVIISKELPPL